VTNEYCFWLACFVPLDADGTKLFGFSELLAGLALMVLAWTIADTRYRFRISCAPIPLYRVTFWMIAVVSVLILLTDLWRAEQWYVPRISYFTPTVWQTILAGTVLSTFLTWAWFAFIRPPVYGKFNAERFARTVYSYILRGSPAELGVVADELSRSAHSIISSASDQRRHQRHNKIEADKSKVERYANDLLLLIADKRFCRAIVASSPGTALEFFSEVAGQKRFGVPIETFSRNIVNEALENPDSFMFHEAEGYDTGYLGYQKPLTSAMFSDYAMAQEIGTLLDPNVTGMRNWDAQQWKAYCRVVLIVFRSYVQQAFWSHSNVLFRAITNIEHAADDIYKINGLQEGAFNEDPLKRLRVVLKFVSEAIKILEEEGVPDDLRLRVRKYDRPSDETFYDHLSNLIFEVIHHAAYVRSPQELCWWTQHNAVWAELFNFGKNRGAAGKAIKFKVRRLLYDEILRMEEFPNFKGARILRFCLNVMGLEERKNQHDSDTRALHRAVLSWTRKNYAWLHSYNPKVAEACLVDGVKYKPKKKKLIKTYPADGLRRSPLHIRTLHDSP